MVDEPREPQTSKSESNVQHPHRQPSSEGGCGGSFISQGQPHDVNAHHKAKRRNYWIKFSDAIQGGILLVTLFLVIISGCELRELKKATRLDQRAWVGIIGGIPPQLNVGAVPIFGVKLLNSGKTPALNFSGIVVYQPFTKGEAFVASYPQIDETESIAVLQPSVNTLLTVKARVPATAEDIQKFKDGSVVMHVFGKIKYTDIFRCQHWTTFCLYIDKDLVNSKACNTYNETDDNNQCVAATHK